MSASQMVQILSYLQPAERCNKQKQTGISSDYA